MNKAFLFFLLVFISTTITAQKGFEVKIKLDGIGENKIRIYSQRNNANKHKMVAIPVCEIPKGLK